jgi:cysteine desulfurase
MDLIYLDHNATTPLEPQVAAAMAECAARCYANPASQHQAGRHARQVLEDARDEIAALLGACRAGPRPDRLIFTSGGTEANNLALFGLAGDPAISIAAARIEHPSILGPIAELVRRGAQHTELRVHRHGAIDLDHLRDFLTTHASPLTTYPPLVTLMLGNNETGVLQPVAEAAALCRQAGVPMHTDAVQAAGKLPIDFHSLSVTTLSIAAHKFGGPRGIGALLLRGEAMLAPMLFGGFQQHALRPGTESVTLALGMATALRLWHAERDARLARMTQLRDRLEQLLVAGYHGAVVHGQSAARLPHTTNISFPGLDRQALQIALDLSSVACSTGSACASGSSDPSATLVAMGCFESEFSSALRFSIGPATTTAEIDEVARRILKCCNDLKSRIRNRKSAADARISP